jgi:hypothetical protein
VVRVSPAATSYGLDAAALIAKNQVVLNSNLAISTALDIDTPPRVVDEKAITNDDVAFAGDDGDCRVAAGQLRVHVTVTEASAICKRIKKAT